jgi:hypothetical protein
MKLQISSLYLWIKLWTETPTHTHPVLLIYIDSPSLTTRKPKFMQVSAREWAKHRWKKFFNFWERVVQSKIVCLKIWGYFEENAKMLWFSKKKKRIIAENKYKYNRKLCILGNSIAFSTYWGEGQAYADPGGRTPINASGNFCKKQNKKTASSVCIGPGSWGLYCNSWGWYSGSWGLYVFHTACWPRPFQGKVAW